MNKINWIKLQLANYPNQPPSLLTSVLNTQSWVSNPVPRATVPKQITIEQAFALVPNVETFPISETRTYSRLLEAFQQGRIDWVQDNITTLVNGGKMTLSTAQALGTLMAETELDPNWQAQILASPAQLAGYGVIQVNDIDEALKAI